MFLVEPSHSTVYHNSCHLSIVAAHILEWDQIEHIRREVQDTHRRNIESAKLLRNRPESVLVCLGFGVI